MIESIAFGLIIASVTWLVLEVSWRVLSRYRWWPRGWPRASEK
jgi:hypothetical protein